MPELLTAPSYLPADELFIHIAGGFFSCFEGRRGFLSDRAGNPCGTLSFRINELRQESHYVYVVEGTMTVQDEAGLVQCYAMHRLDYVRLPDSDHPAYRLGGDGATLVVIALVSAAPCLIGQLFVSNTRGYEFFAISMRGRDESEAERHLWQRIRRLTAGTDRAGDED